MLQAYNIVCHTHCDNLFSAAAAALQAACNDATSTDNAVINHEAAEEVQECLRTKWRWGLSKSNKAAGGLKMRGVRGSRSSCGARKAKQATGGRVSCWLLLSEHSGYVIAHTAVRGVRTRLVLLIGEGTCCCAAAVPVQSVNQ
jgi:hypothetical protein